MSLTIDHTAIVISASKLDDFVRSLLAAPQPPGLKETMRFPNSIGLGDQRPLFWVTGIEGDAETLKVMMQNEHTAFIAGDDRFVDKFYEAALESGGIDNGAPGPRPQYHHGYYRAFVRDPGCGSTSKS